MSKRFILVAVCVSIVTAIPAALSVSCQSILDGPNKKALGPFVGSAAVEGRTEVVLVEAPAIAVTWTDLDSGRTGTVSSDGDGRYRIDSLRPGRYSLEGTGQWQGKDVAGGTFVTLAGGECLVRDIQLNGSLGEEIMANGGFENETGGQPDDWNLYAHSGSFSGSAECDGDMPFGGTYSVRTDLVRLGNGPWEPWHASLSQSPFSLEAGKDYLCNFAARADSARDIGLTIIEYGGNWHWFGGGTFRLGTEWKEYSIVFTSLENSAAVQLQFELADPDGTWTTSSVWFDAVSLQAFPFRGQKAPVAVNQAGYAPAGAKVACIGRACSDFDVVDAATGQVVFSGNCALAVAGDPASGEDVYEADFTAFGTPGEYWVDVAGAGRSAPFVIAADVYARPATLALKGLYYQRCGTAFDVYHCEAPAWAHAACHTGEAEYHSSSGFTGTKDVAGGWHDAGDFGRYTVPAAVAVGYLLRGYERNAGYFEDGALDIPESRNGVADVLDEARYELEWLLTMQDAASGGVFHKVTTENFPQTCMPEDDPAPLYIFEISSTATADFAAVLAQAARVYAPIDAAFSTECLAAAVGAWDFLQANPGIYPPPSGFQNPPGVTTGDYSDSHDSDERLWAAAELFLTTGDSAYGDYFDANYHVWWGATYAWTNSWQSVGNHALNDYALFGPAGPVRDEIRSDLESLALGLAAAVDGSGYGAFLSPSEYYWGSNMLVLDAGATLMDAFALTGNSAFHDAASRQLDYILGVNANAISHLSGCGTHFPLTQHHAPSFADSLTAGVTGFVSGGPDRYLSDNVLTWFFDGTTPPAACFIDRAGSYASNEITVYWNAPLVTLIAQLSGT